jgi:hypothetical protein
MPRKTPERLKLEEEYVSIIEWAIEQNGGQPFNVIESWLKKYTKWDLLGATLVAFLLTKQGAKWNKPEIELVEEVIWVDYHACMLFRSIDSDLFKVLAHAEYPTEDIKRHFLKCNYHTSEKKTKEDVYLHFLYDGPGEYNKLDAFRQLSRMGWEGTSEHAQKLWDSHDDYFQEEAVVAWGLVDAPEYTKVLQEKLSSSDEYIVQKFKKIERRVEWEIESRKPMQPCFCKRCKPQAE